MSSSTAVRTVRKIHSLADNQTIKVPSKFDKPWFTEQAKALRSDAAKEVYLLSLHDDGVIWGKLNDQDELLTSDGITNSPSPEFRLETLQECRLFSERGELLIWRASETECKARQILDEGEFADTKLERLNIPPRFGWHV